MFHWIYFGFLWALTGFVAWRIGMKRIPRPTLHDYLMLAPALMTGPVMLTIFIFT